MTTGSPVYFDSSTSKFRYGADVEIPQVDVAADSGTLSENTAWSDIPSKSAAAALNTQAKALQERTNWIRANQPIVVTNVAAVRALDKTKIGYAVTKGYYTAGDGGAGEYWYDGSDTTSTDNGGTIIVASDSGRWKLISSGRLNIKHFGAKADSSFDSGPYINKCFEEARRRGCPVYIPNGGYLSSVPLLYGTNSTTSQSSAPTGIFGDGQNSKLIASASMTGAFLRAVGAAGTVFSDFVVDAKSFAETALDTSWMVGAGPSVQNKYTNMWVRGSTGTAWKAVNNNDCCFKSINIKAKDSSTCALSHISTGGLAYMEDCIWYPGYLDVGWQNGSIINSWGDGIQFSSGGMNVISLIGCYIYENGSKGGILWSSALTSHTGLRSLYCESTQFVSLFGQPMMKLSLCSGATFKNCWFAEDPKAGYSSATQLWNPASFVDGYGALVEISGGVYYNTLSFNPPYKVAQRVSGIYNLQTSSITGAINGQPQTVVSDSYSSSVAANTYTTLLPSGTLQDGVYNINVKLRFSDSPFEVQFNSTIPITTSTIGWGSTFSSLSIPTVVAEYNISLHTTGTMTLIDSSGTVSPAIALSCSVPVPAGTTYTVTCTRVV